MKAQSSLARECSLIFLRPAMFLFQPTASSIRCGRAGWRHSWHDGCAAVDCQAATAHVLRDMWPGVERTQFADDVGGAFPGSPPSVMAAGRSAKSSIISKAVNCSA